MIFIVADDLTGANDTGAQYTNDGYNTVVLADGDLDYLEQCGDDYEVVSINMNSRILQPAAAYRKVYQLAKSLSCYEVEYFYKKVDSLMRGNPVEEIEAMMDALHIPVAVVSPGFADYNRVVRGGRLLTLSKDRTEQVADIVDLCKRRTKKQVVNVPLKLIGQGPQEIKKFINELCREGEEELIAVADAETDKDFSAICEGFSFLGKKALFSGSAGLARALSRKQQRNTSVGGNGHTSPKRILVVIGSRNATTAKQVEALCDARQISMVVIPSEELLGEGKLQVVENMVAQVEDRLRQGQTLVVLVTATLLQQGGHDLQEGTEDALVIMDAFGRMVQEICSANLFDVVVSSGGDTSMVILQSIHAKGMKVISEIMPGIPCGRILGGDLDNALMITKSGGFGHDDSLVRVVEYIESNTL